MTKLFERSQDEQEIRAGIVDVLCFISSGNATKEQMNELKVRIAEAVLVIQKEKTAEHAA